MERQIRAVIFDQDGLMFDTERISAASWEIAKKELKLEIELPESFLCTMRGMVPADAESLFKKQFGADFDYQKLRVCKQKHFMRTLREQGVPVKPGLRELLAYLKEHDYKIVLATASNQEYSRTNLKETGIDEYFPYMVTGDMVEHAKPDPEVFLRAAELVGEQPEHCLVLEDSLNGVQAGLTGGFHVIMVPDLTQPSTELRAKVDRVCGSLADVIGWLEER
jgi:HAD superfamily hydrolase (TIGR01509 family)